MVRWDPPSSEEDEEDSPDHTDWLGGRTAGGVRYVDHAFPERPSGQYVYRQFSDGSILIVENPASGPYAKGSEPALITRESNPKAWRSITNAIQAKRAGKSAQTVEAFAKIASIVALTAVSIAAASARKPRRRRRSRERAETLPPPAPPMEIPWLPIGVAVAATVAFVVLR